VGLKTLHWSVGCARKEKSNDSKRDPIEPPEELAKKMEEVARRHT
jgi:hypothetical protein